MSGSLKAEYSTRGTADYISAAEHNGVKLRRQTTRRKAGGRHSDLEAIISQRIGVVDGKCCTSHICMIGGMPYKGRNYNSGCLRQHQKAIFSIGRPWDCTSFILRSPILMTRC